MATDNPNRALGGLLIQDRQDGEHPLWRLNARARRVPLTGKDDGTPGVHGLRATWIRSKNRELDVLPTASVKYQDPVLQTLFVSARTLPAKVELEVAGMQLNAELHGEQKVEAWWLKNRIHAYPGGIDVPPCALHASFLRLQPGALNGVFHNAPLVAGAPIDLESKGVVFTVEVPHLMRPKDKALGATVRLVSDANDRYALELLPDRQTPVNTLQWRAFWTDVQHLLETSRKTAWLSADLVLPESLPKVVWPVQFKKKKLEVDWNHPLLPENLVQVRLSDQPLESQQLAPEGSILLFPSNVDIKFPDADDTLSLSWQPKHSPSGIAYRWSHGKPDSSERITFGKMTLVHESKAVLQQLRTAYEVPTEAPLVEETGFLKESRGWLELPFAPDSSRPADDKLASPTLPSEPSDGQGWLRLGLRRHALHRPGAAAEQVPWSLRIDVPSQFAFLLSFDLKAGMLKSAEVDLDLASCSLSITGALWLAGRKPDSHDALPRIDGDPDAFFPVELKSCVPKGKEKVPFEIDGLYVEAPRLIGTQWDDREQRWARSPSLASDAKLLTRSTVLSPGAKTVRGWFRHPRLPSIQLMPVTLSNLASTVPHASRSLQLFESSAQEFTLTGFHTLQPSIEPTQRSKFAPLAGLETRSAALTLPGNAFEPKSPDAYVYEGYYTLPVCTEPHARAGLPQADAEDASTPEPAPEITARDRLGIVELAKERVVMGKLADVRWGAMFPLVEPGKTVALTKKHLAPPRTWSASARVDDSVVLKEDDGGVLGTLTLTGIGTHAWSGTGDQLLIGPERVHATFTDDQVIVSPGDGVPLIGWSIEEQQVGDLVIDGQGLGHELSLRRQDGLLRRSVHLKHSQAAGELLSTAQPLTASLPDAGRWHFAFTDLFVSAGGSVWNPPAADLLNGSMDACWTWSLIESDPPGNIVSLPMGDVFRFAPALLVEVRFSADAKSVIGCTIEGSLGLGTSSEPLPTDSLARVRIVLSAAGDGLALTGIAPVGSAGVAWPLDKSLSVLGVDTASLKAKSLALAGGKLKIAGIDLTMNALGDVVPVQMDYVSDTVLAMIPRKTPDDRSLRIQDAGIDLGTARLTRLTASVRLRPGVIVGLSESLDGDNKTTTSTSQMTWFGNTIRFGAVSVDPLARAFTLGMPPTTELEVIPGMAAGTLQTASLAFTTEGYARDGFSLRSVFCEVIADLGDELGCSHLLFGEEGAAPTDRFRFDGPFQRRSCIEWPDVAPRDLGAGDSVDVEFGGRPRVAHRMAVLLQDHCIDGATVDARGGGKRGLQLRERGNYAPIVWLAQSGHELSWPTTPTALKFDAAVTLQVWPADMLLKAIKDIGDNFTFTASYRGNERDDTPDFPVPGLRRVRAGGLAGLFDADVENALAKLRDAWLLVGSGSFLVPDRTDPASHLQVHLPFVALFDKSVNDSDNELRRTLAPPPDPGRALRMSSHDLLATPILVGPDAATPLSRFATPTTEPLPFTTSFKGANGASGSLLTRGFLEKEGTWEAGWHVEQFQPPGLITALPRLPFRFPRAAVMLSALRKWPVTASPMVLSTLAAFDPGDADRTLARTVFVESRDAFDERSGSSRSRGQQHRRADMVVGTGSKLVSIALDPSQVRQDSSPSRWLAWVLARVSEPLFVVLRSYDQQVHHEPLRLPPSRQPALSRSAFRLRSQTLFRNDGRRTWGSSGTPENAGMEVAVTQRRHAQLRGTPSRSLSGDLHPSRLVGTPFQATEAANGSSVWLQRSDEVVLATVDIDTQDAAPVATAANRLVRPLVPSVRSVGQALLRLDPALGLKDVKLQTALPPVLHDLDQSDRTGAFSLNRVRLLRGLQEVGNGSSAAASAGPMAIRSTRLPRPKPLPPNGEKSPWLRPVAWYGKPDSPCFVLPGRWDGISGIPASSASAPPWLLLIGMPEAEAAAPSNEEVVWNGAVSVRCMAFEAGLTHKNAAKELMTLLADGKTPARAGLRHGSRFTPFERVKRVTRDNGEDVLVFLPKADSEPIGRLRTKCLIELAFDVRQDWPKKPDGQAVVTLRDAPPSTLQGLDVHSIAIEIAAPRADQFPLPLSTRTVFFDDPEYDRVLNESVQGTSAYTQPAQGKPIQFWADRRSVTVQETLVIRSGASDMKLTAAVRRRGASEYMALKFELSKGASSSDVSLDADNPYTLPMPILANTEGSLRAGDLLRLEASAGTSGTPATLFFQVTSKPSLPMPEAMYSLLAFDLPAQSAWCALHSPNPTAQKLLSYQQAASAAQKLLRRSHFRWEATEASTGSLKHTLMKMHLASESTHVPQAGEEEIGPARSTRPPSE